MLHQQNDVPKQKKYWRFAVQIALAETQFFHNVETFSVGPSGVLILTDPKTERQVMVGPAARWIAFEQEEKLA